MTMQDSLLARIGLAFLAGGLIAIGSATAADDKANPRPVGAAEEAKAIARPYAERFPWPRARRLAGMR